jgi:hypothetical protein
MSEPAVFAVLKVVVGIGMRQPVSSRIRVPSRASAWTERSVATPTLLTSLSETSICTLVLSSPGRAGLSAASRGRDTRVRRARAMSFFMR